MKTMKIVPKCCIGLLIIAIIACLSTSAMAQFFPTIRTNPYFGYAPFMPVLLPPPAPIFPPPVVRTAATTITLWDTVGTANALIVYNPTALIGAPAPPVSPSPLLSLIAGVLLTPIGHSALSTTNPLFFNYLANTYLLPTGLGIYVFP
ncbi:MAG: hypothetical protein ACMUIP_03710 [bacterium]